MRFAHLFAAVLLGACATHDAAVPITRITYEAMSWGYVQERWSISASGDASLETLSEGAQLGTPTTTRAITLTPEDFERIRDALAPVQRLKGDIPCERVITDLPYGAVRWALADGTEQSVRYDVGCRPNSRLELLFERMEAASAIFHDAIEEN